MGFLTLILLSLAAHTTGQNGCFYPNGSPSPDIPCDSTAPVSMCCGSRSSCLSSGLCLLDGTTPSSGIGYARGTCTDSTWKSPFCPQHCQLSQETARGNTSAYDFRAGGVQVWECVGEGYAKPAAYCCESAREKTRCCQTPEAVFSLPGATVGNAASVQTFSGQGSTATSSRISSSASQSTTTATGGGSGRSSTDTSAAGSSSTPAGTSSADASRSTGVSDQVTGGNGGLSRDVTLGIAIAIPLVVVALVAGLVFLWYRKKSANATTVPPAGAQGVGPERWYKAELDGNGVPFGAAAKELDPNNEVKELCPEAMIVEAPGDVPRYQNGWLGNQPVELDAGRQR